MTLLWLYHNPPRVNRHLLGPVLCCANKVDISQLEFLSHLHYGAPWCQMTLQAPWHTTRLLHIPSLAAIGLSVGYETWLPILSFHESHEEFLLGCHVAYSLDKLSNLIDSHRLMAKEPDWPASLIHDRVQPVNTSHWVTEIWSCSAIDLLHKSHSAPGPYPTMHYFVTEMCTCVHISATNGYIVGYLSNATEPSGQSPISQDDVLWYHCSARVVR